jgi:quinol monooxygenase YgiN
VIVISLALRVPPGDLERFRAAVAKLVKHSRAESGVIAYSFAVDMIDCGLIRIFECFRDQAALDAHMVSAHFLEWRSLSAHYPREERRLFDATPRA